MNLTQRDRELIVQQCQNQGATSPEQIAGFALAYADAKWTILTMKPETWAALYSEIASIEDVPNFLEGKILEWADLVEPRNEKGYRTTPAVFRSGRAGINAQLIPRAMENLLNGGPETPEEFFREFQEIHPFEDGNGRVGHLLWAVMVACQTGKWPETLPPEIDWTK